MSFLFRSVIGEGRTPGGNVLSLNRSIVGWQNFVKGLWNASVPNILPESLNELLVQIGNRGRPHARWQRSFSQPQHSGMAKFRQRPLECLCSKYPPRIVE